jgi:hypothetical protein
LGGDEVYQGFLVDDRALAEGLATGAFTLDTRLRDELCGVRADAMSTPESEWKPPTAELLREIDAHQGNDSAARLLVGVDAVSARQQALENLRVVRAQGRRRH